MTTRAALPPATLQTHRRPSRSPSPRRVATPAGVARYVVLVACGVLVLSPVVWTLWTALTPLEAGTDVVRPGFSAFVDVFAQVDYALLFLNSVLVTGLVVAGQMIVSAMAGYVLATVDFRGRQLLFGAILATMMVPLQVTIVPVFMLIRGMGLSDTLLALIIPAIPTAFGTFLMRQYFLTLPAELGEAAAIDGAGHFRTFFSVYAPLALPGMAIVGILAFNTHWNEFFRPLILTLSEQNFTLPLGLVSLQGNLGSGSTSTILAGVVLSMIPALIVFVLGQRPLREGLTAGVSK
ncbi:carbohydrate ABC transporter permease [Desertihabitans brevis]|uniref:Carbohydrate ABC transporter permease n=1 Tax=Desertihabitans brevis TaxID=2268447 RepID=A0A367YV45_9ACTN|nr:carbohydrate ABC transporter permease [Desertihabitans brevis]RCK68831.1 carbohydrate ABC transporter permease [Desertihabitans brevis]